MSRSTITRYKVLQIIPAQPGAFAIFCNREEDALEFWRNPIAAWGLYLYWDADAETGRRVSEIRRTAGPLETNVGTLEPIDHDSRFHEGIEISGFIELNDGARYVGGPKASADGDGEWNKWMKQQYEARREDERLATEKAVETKP